MVLFVGEGRREAIWAWISACRAKRRCSRSSWVRELSSLESAMLGGFLCTAVRESIALVLGWSGRGLDRCNGVYSLAGVSSGFVPCQTAAFELEG